MRETVCGSERSHASEHHARIRDIFGKAELNVGETMDLKLAMALVALILGAASPATSAPAKAPYYGINHDFVWTEEKDWPHLIAAMKEARVEAVRIPLRWPTVEPEKGKWDYSRVDKVVKALRDAKIEILATFLGVPVWASGVDPEEVKGFYDCFPPQDMGDWQEFVRRTVTRYKGDIRLWEIWNEENGAEFFRPEPDAEKYVEMLKSAHGEIRKIDPGAVVVLGGLVMNGVIANPWSEVKVPNFLQAIYDAGGKAYFDVVNIHPYVVASDAEGPDYLIKLTRETIEVMKKNGDAQKPLWITETGCFADENITQQRQAEHLTGVFRELKKLPEVKAVYWFTLRDYGQSILGGENTMGLLTNTGEKKPMFDAYKNLPRH